MSKVTPLQTATDEARDAFPADLPARAGSPTTSGSAAGAKSSRTIDRAKMNIRRGSRRVIQLFEPKQNDELQLDLDQFYTARLRRRTHLQEEITGTLVRGGVDITNGEVAGPAKSRGIVMTLSPGEEYENYQKVNLATKFHQSALLPTEHEDGEDTKIPEEEEEDGNDGVGIEGQNEPMMERGMSSRSAGSVDGDRTRSRKAAVTDPISGAALIEMKALASATPVMVSSPTLRHLIKRNTMRVQAKEFSRSKKMINPHGRIRLAWDLLSVLFILYNAFVLPFRASFDPSDSSEDDFDTFLDFFFMFDILVTFNTAVEVDGSVQYSRRAAAKSYLTGWFIVDIVAAIPYDQLIPDSASLNSSSLRHSLKLLRLVRLLRLLRISRIFRRIRNAIFIRSTLTSLFKYILMVVFVSHWFSCIFHAIGASQSSNTNWIIINKLNDPIATRWDRYVAALYFSVMTLATIGFGDISGTNADERLFSIFAMIVGGGIFAYGITNIVELVSSLTIAETRFRSKMDEVNEYMAARELPMKVRIEIREFYHNTRQSRESKLNGEIQILSELSSKLRSKIALSINDQFLRKFPFFTGSDPNFLLELALNMRMIHFAPLEDVIIEGEIGHEMFFIFRGAVEVMRNGTQIGILGENQYFGEMAILSPDNRRRATVRTLCFCELRMLSRNRFLDALALFPAMQAKMAQVARSRQPIKPPSPRKSGSSGDPKDANAAQPSIDKISLLPEPQLTIVRQPSHSRLPMGNAATSASLRIQQNEQRKNSSFVQKATTAARLNAVVRRSSAAAGTGISAAMAQALSEISSNLEEATRRQEMLVTHLIKMQTELERLQAGG